MINHPLSLWTPEVQSAYVENDNEITEILNELELGESHEICAISDEGSLDSSYFLAIIDVLGSWVGRIKLWIISLNPF